MEPLEPLESHVLFVDAAGTFEVGTIDQINGHYLQTQAPTADFSPDWTHVVAVGPHILFVRNDGLFAVGHIDQKTGHYVETDGAAGAFSSPLFSPGLDPHRGGGRGWDEHGWQRGLCCRRGATAMTKPAGQVPARVAGLRR